MFAYAILATGVLSAIFTVYLMFNAAKGIDPLYVLSSFIITTSIFGYFLYVSADNYESLMYANAVAYIGGIFLPMIMVFMLSDFSGSKLPVWFKIFIVSANLLLFLIVLLSFKFHFYYQTSFYDPEGSVPLVSTPGPGYYFRLVILAVEVILCIFFTVLTFIGRKTASWKTMWIFLSFMIVTIVAYAATSIAHVNHGYVAFAYLACQVALLYTINKFQLYNITSSTQGRAMVTFDRRLRLTGFNTQATTIFPDVGKTRIDTEIITDSYALNEVLRWIRKNTPSLKIGSTITKDFIINENSLTDNIHIKCRFSPISFGFAKVIAGYMLEMIDETEQINKINELNLTGVKLKQEAERQTKRAENLQGSVILGMASMIESRDNSTGGHINRTSACVQLFVEEIKKTGKYNMSENYWSNVINAAPLHDLGKIAVDDRILRKHKELTDEEYLEMQRHAEVGAEIVQQVLADVNDKDFIRVASNVAHYHHEKYNGTGYPDGLSGNRIPFEARIMALADVFDALVSKRYYKETMSYDQAFDIIRKDLNTHFDPELGKIFLKMKDKIIALYESFYGDDDPALLKQ